MAVIEIKTLTRFYGQRRGVEGVELSVPEGSLFGFLGPNGAGKTTTIRVLLGLLRPTSGQASIFGLDCWTQGRRIKAEVGYVPGDLRLYPWLTGFEALRLVGAIRARHLIRAGQDLAATLGLDLRTRVRAMSKGTRQKLGLVLAMAHRPRLLVLDEPTTGLDPLVQAGLRAELKSLAAAGHTIFFSSHTLSEVEDLCDRVAIVKEGRIVADEPLAALRARAGHEIVIRWRDAQSAAAQPPPWLDVEHDGMVWKGSVNAPAADLIAFLNGRHVEDLTVGRPDLETLFRRFYERGPA